MAQGTEVKREATNADALHAYDKSSIETLVNELRGDDPQHATVGEFGWYDLAGDGQYELVVTLDFSGRACFDYLVAYKQSALGKIEVQHWIEGNGIGHLDNVIRDLDGDGRKELIIPTVLVSYSTADTLTWPAVYRLKDGKYLEASRDFPNYYYDDVLPPIDRGIADIEKRIPPSREREVAESAPLMLKSKILRLVGRDPNAGLAEAREWMKSDDPVLLQFAMATFGAIGGHDDELREATQARNRAICKEHPGMVMCDKAAVERQVREACRQDPHMTVCGALQ